MHQVSRRVIHWGCNTEDQDLIIALQNQVDREHLKMRPEEPIGPGQPLEQPTGPMEPGQSLVERPTRPSTRQQPAEPPWEAALRAVGNRTPIYRQELVIARESATAEILAVTVPDQGAGDLVVIALEATIERVSTGASTNAPQHWQAIAS